MEDLEEDLWVCEGHARDVRGHVELPVTARPVAGQEISGERGVALVNSISERGLECAAGHSANLDLVGYQVILPGLLNVDRHGSPLVRVPPADSVTPICW